MTDPRLGPGAEFDLIRRFLPGGAAPGTDVLVGAGDDCAVVVGDGIALSTDMSVEGVHFRRDWLSAAEIGYRAAAAALSDLAGVAARPIGLLVSLAVPESDAGEFAVELMAGVARAATSAGAIILGGDLARSPGPVVIDVTVVGEAPHPVLRSGAQPGDEIWITGDLGGSGAAVARLLRGEDPGADARARFCAPIPRIREAIWLRERGIPAAMLDLSDGLAGDATHLAAASGVAIVLDAALIPIHSAAVEETRSREAALDLAIAGGEDYEICFACRPSSLSAGLSAFSAAFQTRLTRVGMVEEGEGVYWRANDGGRAALERGGYQHFGS